MSNEEIIDKIKIQKGKYAMNRKTIEDRIKLYKIIIMLCNTVLLRNAENSKDKLRTIQKYTNMIVNCKVKIKELEYNLINVY